jgi:hypothetical protein
MQKAAADLAHAATVHMLTLESAGVKTTGQGPYCTKSGSKL